MFLFPNSQSLKIRIIKIGGASGMYRLQEPYQNLDFGYKYVFSDYLTDDDIADEELKAVIIQRPAHPEMPQFIMDLRKAGKIVVGEIDDDLTNIPASNHSFNEFKGRLKDIQESLKCCDYVHVSTPELKKNDRYIVFGNAIRTEKYVEEKKWNEPKIVGWHGSPTHTDSLLMIKEVIKELLSGGVRVILQSNLDWLKTIFSPHPLLELKGWVNVDESYRIPMQFDINLAPLPDTAFNRSKSELRCIEAAAWSVPTVSSDVAPYRRFHTLSGGANILIKKERTKEWVKEIMKLLEDKEHYSHHSRLSKEAVLKHYDLKIINQKRKEWWLKVLEK